MGFVKQTVLSSLLATSVLAAPKRASDPPNVSLDYATFKGLSDPTTQTWNYLGVPYAEVGRFEHSRLPTTKLDGVQDATRFGSACIQKSIGSIFADTNSSLSDAGVGEIVGAIVEGLGPISPQSEDCLSINVQVPENTSADAKLPIIMWIHGGGFEVGSAYAVTGETLAAPGLGPNYRPAGLAKTAIDMGQPIMVVSINYRLNNFGFSASKEMEEAGLLNLGLEDQRNAMRWVKKYAAKFGGDPDALTIMGESAGSQSVVAHLLWDEGNTEGLFRGAIAISGGPVVVDGPEKQQGVFDRMVEKAGCTGAADKIACLKTADHDALVASVNGEEFFLGYHSLGGTWTIRPDGNHFKDSPHRLAAAGKFAKVPLMIGDMRDEGTLFSQINQLTVLTDDQFKDYFQNEFWPHATDEDMAGLMRLYPQDPTKGSPYGTGILNAISPQYKRLASVTGDAIFEAPRRNLLQHYPAPVWNYLCEIDLPAGGLLPNTVLTKIPILGSFHAFDVFFYMFANLPRALSKNVVNRQATAISFTRTLDPNNHGLRIPKWPQWSKSGIETYRFLESGPQVVKDDYRVAPIDFLVRNADAFRI